MKPCKLSLFSLFFLHFLVFSFYLLIQHHFYQFRTSKTLFVYEDLSQPSELQAAIEGNKREGRRVSNPGFPTNLQPGNNHSSQHMLPIQIHNAATNGGTGSTSDGHHSNSVTVLHGSSINNNLAASGNNSTAALLTPQNIVLNRLGQRGENGHSGLNTQAIITSIANGTHNSGKNHRKEEKQPDLNMVYQMLKQLEQRIDHTQSDYRALEKNSIFY